MKKKVISVLIIALTVINVFSVISNANPNTLRTSSRVTSSEYDWPEDGKVRIVTSAGDTSGAAPSLNRIIGAAITIVQVVGSFLAVILITITIVRFVCTYYKIYNLQRNATADDAEKIDELRKKLYKMKIHSAIWIICAVVLFAASGMLSIVKSFKPIIYIYPEEDGTEISVELSNPEKLTCSYPEYNDGWKVVADKDGTLKEVGKDREYYSLYWEGLIKEKEFKDGFVVKGEDTREFLEEKLAILGLTDKEAEEFIVYWLPKMQNNRYNMIRFLEAEELNEEMELKIDPTPDTLIRIQMQYKPLLFKKNITEQELEKVERNGYTVVEWGGSKVN